MKLGLNNKKFKINKQNVEFNKIKLNIPNIKNVIIRIKFFKKIYNDAEPYIKNFIKNFKNIKTLKKLTQLNRNIEKRN